MDRTAIRKQTDARNAERGAARDPWQHGAADILPPEADRLVPISFVLRRYSTTSMSIWRRIGAGKFPKPDMMLGNRRHWYLSTLLRFEHSLAVEG